MLIQTSASLLLAGGAAPPSLPLLSLAEQAVPGPQLVDIFYIGGVLAVGAFGARQVFDSAFAENTNEYVPPLPGFKGLTKLFGGEDGAAREEAAAVQQAEVLRQRITDAAAAGDIETAYRSEKELKQLLLESGIRYMINDPDAAEEDLPDNW